MRVCVPTENKEGLNAKVHGHFGSAQYFTVYDTEKDTVNIIDNTNAHHSHGTCHPIGVLGTGSIDVVVCKGMGSRAVQKLNSSRLSRLYKRKYQWLQYWIVSFFFSFSATFRALPQPDPVQ